MNPRAFCIFLTCLSTIAFSQDKSKTTFDHYRLIAYAAYDEPGHAIQDSFFYMYSHGRGGFVALDKPYEGLETDSFHHYQFNTPIPNLNESVCANKFDNNNNLLYQEFTQQVSGTPNNFVYHTITYQYDNNYNLVSKLTKSMTSIAGTLENYQLQIFRYDGQNRLVSDSLLFFDYTNYNWRNHLLLTYNYDFNSNIVFEEVKQASGVGNPWRNSRKTYRMYNQSNLLLERKVESWNQNHAYWQWYTKDSSCYNSINLLIEKYGFEYDTTCKCWEIDVVNMFTYDNWDYVNKSEMLLFDNNTWQPFIKDTFSYDQNHNQIEKITSFGNTWTGNWANNKRTTAQFTTDGQPTRKTTDEWDPVGNWKNMLEEYFYYESYIPSSLTTISKKELNLNLFPNPANYYIKVDASGWKQKQVVIAIFNSSGVLCHQWSENDASREITIPTSQLPDGTYFLKVSTTSDLNVIPFMINH